MTANEYGVFSWGNENYLKLAVMVAQPDEYIKSTELYTFKDEVYGM